MSHPAWRIKGQFGAVSYRTSQLLPIHQLDSVVSLWK
jgi:hypothetical protein